MLKNYKSYFKIVSHFVPENRLNLDSFEIEWKAGSLVPYGNIVFDTWPGMGWGEGHGWETNRLSST